MVYDTTKSMKGAESKRLFADLPDDVDVSFGLILGQRAGSLSIFRLKRHGDNLINVEFNEDFEVTHDPSESA